MSTIRGSGGFNTPVRYVSWYGRVNYSLMDKYLFTATVRRDGSSKFGSGNRFGTFPSLSLAWRASEEDFIKNLNLFSNLKVRVGWAQVSDKLQKNGGVYPGKNGKHILYPYRNQRPNDPLRLPIRAANGESAQNPPTYSGHWLSIPAVKWNGHNK